MAGKPNTRGKQSSAVAAQAGSTLTGAGPASMVSEPMILGSNNTTLTELVNMGGVRIRDPPLPSPPPKPPWLSSRSKERVYNRSNQIDTKFDDLMPRLTRVETELEKGGDRTGDQIGICNQFERFDSQFLGITSNLSGMDATFLKIEDHIEDLNSNFADMNSTMVRMERMLVKIEGALNTQPPHHSRSRMEVSKLEVEASSTTRKQQRPPQGWYRPLHLRRNAFSTPTPPRLHSGMKELDSEVEMQSALRFPICTPTVRRNFREKTEIPKRDPKIRFKVPKLHTSRPVLGSEDSNPPVERHVMKSTNFDESLRNKASQALIYPPPTRTSSASSSSSHPPCVRRNGQNGGDSKLQVEVRPTNSNEVSPVPYASGPPNASFLFDADEYYCNICSINCTFKRFSCKKLLDYDLCLNCFSSGRFGLDVTPLDFTLIKSAKIPSGSVGPQGTQAPSSQQPLVTCFVSTIPASPPMTLVFDDKTSPPLTPSIHSHVLRGSFGEGQSNSIEDNAEISLEELQKIKVASTMNVNGTSCPNQLKAKLSLQTFVEAQLKRLYSVPATQETLFIHQGKLMIVEMHSLVGIEASVQTVKWPNPTLRLRFCQREAATKWFNWWADFRDGVLPGFGSKVASSFRLGVAKAISFPFDPGGTHFGLFIFTTSKKLSLLFYNPYQCDGTMKDATWSGKFIKISTISGPYGVFPMTWPSIF